MQQKHKREIGVFSGSFNPIHIGHLVLANYITEFTYINEVWFVVSPHNPLKTTINMANETQRFEMCKLAIRGMSKFKVSDIEIGMPKPSYTINTLDRLKKDYPQYNFTLIIGADNYVQLPLWKEYKRLKEENKILVYPRLFEKSIPNFKSKKGNEENVQFCDAPIIEISSTFIRSAIHKGKNISSFLPKDVYSYIIQHTLYQ